MLVWDKKLKERVFVNHKGKDVVQIQRLGRSTFPFFEFIQREDFEGRYEKFSDR
jgi:hypothetical protein